MRSLTVFLFTVAFGGACLAQKWELGAGGGVGVHKNLTVTLGSQNADAGFKPGPAFSAFVSQDLYEHLGGQFRYTFQMNDMKLSSGGAETTFGAVSHAIHYDLMLMGGGREAKTRPYLAGGGGVKVYVGTGAERVTQPLQDFALLTKTKDVRGLISVGGGVKVKVGRRTFLYLDARDYITPRPEKVIAPNTITGAKLGGGWVHDFVPMLSLSFTF